MSVVRDTFLDPSWYDKGINWAARLGREIPVLVDVFGAPGDGGLIDAGCGTGRQTCALAKQGYRMVGADASDEMIAMASSLAKELAVDVAFHVSPYAGMIEKLGGGFDGVYCLGNALAAAGSEEAVREALGQFAKCLRPGGRLFLQVLNFEPMRIELPCVRGPRVSVVDGREYISTRQFHFHDDRAVVTNTTLWHDEGWKQRSHAGRLYPLSLSQLQAWCADAGLRIDDTWGNYQREPFEIDRSVDLIVVATRMVG